jgi:hypothetical protein
VSKRYFGWVDDEGAHVRMWMLGPCIDLPRFEHSSPTVGPLYGWGRVEAGSWRLAAAILWDQLGDELLVRALTSHFREEVIAELREGSWELTAHQVREWVKSWPKSALDCMSSGVNWCDDAELD